MTPNSPSSELPVLCFANRPEDKNLLYNIQLVRAKDDNHSFEFPFADLTFDFASICPLTPSQTNHIFLFLVSPPRALLLLLLVVAPAETGNCRAVLYSVITDMFGWVLFFLFIFQSTVPSFQSAASVQVSTERRLLTCPL